MIAFLRGSLAAKSSTCAYIDVNGVGYQVLCSGRTLSRLPETGKDVQVLTHMQVREDGVTLYGFLSQTEQSLFLKLISVSGVGPKVALSVLSTYEPDEVIRAIAAQDTAAIQHVSGIGKKMASRIILELKGSLDDLGQAADAGRAGHTSQALAGAREALLSMGFTDGEAMLALKDAPDGADEALLLQYALKRLGE